MVCLSDRGRYLGSHGDHFERTRASACMEVLETTDDVWISAGTLAETLIVAGRKGLAAIMAETVETFQFNVAPVLAADAQLVAQAYDRWGKGVHPAALNLGDCFAYALAKQHGCPVLYVGNDFARTDVMSALD